MYQTYEIQTWDGMVRLSQQGTHLMAFKKKEASTDFAVAALRQGRLHFRVLGISPLIYNSVSMKAMQTLLLPKGRKTAAEKLTTLKHEPLKEYRSSVYAHRDDDHKTRLFFPGGGFKKSLQNSAKRVPGVAATEIAQLTWITERDVSIFGIPQIYTTVTRSADIARTPDMRTRAILPQWAASFSIEYVMPQLSDVSVVNLVNAAGLLCGIGDGRQEKGYGHGQFKIVGADNKEDVAAFEAIVKAGGRKAQDAALAEPVFYDLTTEELLTWYDSEIEKQGDRHAKPHLVSDNDEDAEAA